VKRNFLLLQGPSTPFFGSLADHLKTAGHQVFRINFCAGDAVYWGGRAAVRFSAGLPVLKDFLTEKIDQFDITDQVVFGDQRAVHKPALEHGKTLGIRTHVFEEGYFRPHWVTLEREGTNANSLLPRDPKWFRDTSNKLRAPLGVVPFKSPFRERAMHDVAYHLAGLLNPLLFPGYRTHSPVIAPVEYAAYLRRFSLLKIIRERERKRAQALIESGNDYFVLPLQLNSDAQIRDHSQFSDMREVIVQVLESFAKHAPENSKIAIKNHPLDMGLMNYKKIIGDCEKKFGIAGRTVYLEDGDLVSLVRYARGVVTVNSTVGMVALEEGCPTLTLSNPIYNLPGLTCQQPFEAFWQVAQAPDASLYAAFRQVVMAATQVNGGFYCAAGIDLAAKNSSRVLTAQKSPLEQLL
jgi:capsular polysaccharide export protein